jgi:GxxExxY protein
VYKDLTNLHRDITGTVTGCSMTVHSTLGNGFQEVIYQRALAIEMKFQNISFLREFEMPIFYRDEIIGHRRVDFLVEDCISVEIKAIKDLSAIELAQAKNYLEAYNIEVGLLLNFGSTSLQYKRLLNSKADKNKFLKFTQKQNENNPD